MLSNIRIYVTIRILFKLQLAVSYNPSVTLLCKIFDCSRLQYIIQTTKIQRSALYFVHLNYFVYVFLIEMNHILILHRVKILNRLCVLDVL